MIELGRENARSRCLRGTVLAAAVLIASATVAMAQTGTDRQGPVRPGRPFRGLFGGAQPEIRNRYTSLDLTLSFLGGYDQNASATVQGAGGGGGFVDPRFGQSSGMASGSASLVYGKVRDQRSFFVGGRTGFRYYPTLAGLNAADYSASSGYRGELSHRGNMTANADIAYQPFFSLLAIPVFPGGVVPPTTAEYGFAERPSITYGATVDASLAVTRRTHFIGGYGFRGFDLTRSTDAGRVRQHNVRAGLSRDLSRRWVVGGRYNYDHSNGMYTVPTSGSGATTAAQGGEVTFDYRKTLRSRRSIGFGLTSGYSRIETIGTGSLSRFDRQVTAGLRFAADIGRTWNASMDYRRGLRRLPGIVDPVFSNDVQARLAGLIVRRVDVTFTGFYSQGSTTTSTWHGFDTASGTAQVRYAISRASALRGDYIYYWYAFPADGLRPAGFDRRVSRNALRVGFDFWLPFLH